MLLIGDPDPGSWKHLEHFLCLPLFHSVSLNQPHSVWFAFTCIYFVNVNNTRRKKQKQAWKEETGRKESLFGRRTSHVSVFLPAFEHECNFIWLRKDLGRPKPFNLLACLDTERLCVSWWELTGEQHPTARTVVNNNRWSAETGKYRGVIWKTLSALSVVWRGAVVFQITGGLNYSLGFRNYAWSLKTKWTGTNMKEMI